MGLLLSRRLGRSDSAGGANVRAGTAVFAESGIHHVVAFSVQRDRAFGAFGLASAALDTFAIDEVSHEFNPFEVERRFCSISHKE